jgi:hypothetical protein
VQAHFFLQIGVELTAVEEHAQAAKEFFGVAHHDSSIGCYS